MLLPRLGRAGRTLPGIGSVDQVAPFYLGAMAKCLQLLIPCTGRRKLALVQILSQDLLGCGLGRIRKSVYFFQSQEY